MSLLGLGASIAAIVIRKNNSKNVLQPIQGLVSNVKQNNVKPRT
ncbi:hypothetical protein DFO69_2832 [Bacillus subtilis]|nr:hypothetical protein DFO69_2832 [Bacillus subtilis]